MPCIDKIAADILNSCDTIPRGGFETVAWALNRADITTVTHHATYNPMVTAMTRDGGTRAYNVTAVKKEMDGGFDMVSSDDVADTWLNYFSFKPYEKTPQAISNLDDMNDLVIIAELKGDKTEGCFVIYGLERGLWKNAASKRQNDSNGLPIYEMQSQEGQGERYSRFIFWDTDYATTKTAIETLTDEYGPVLNVSNFENGVAGNAYTTFANATTTGFDATSDGGDTHWAGSADEISVVSGEKYLVEFFAVKNSGTLPAYDLTEALGAGSMTSDPAQQVIEGSNTFEFTANTTDTGVLRFSNASTAADFEITLASVRHIL